MHLRLMTKENESLARQLIGSMKDGNFATRMIKWQIGNSQLTTNRMIFNQSWNMKKFLLYDLHRILNALMRKVKQLSYLHADNKVANWNTWDQSDAISK